MLAVLADDLTGALDASAPFAARGMHVEVALTIDALADALGARPAVLAVNLGSRDLDVKLAQSRTIDALALLPSKTRLFKKIDSRLKGHIAAELDVTPFTAALVAPAIPEFGRITRNGHVQGFGVTTPIPIRAALGRHADRSTVPDVLTHDDMCALVGTLETENFDLLVGARGLAEALAERMTGGTTAHVAEIPEGPALFVIGSHDPITLEQVDTLCRTIEVNYLPAPNGKLQQWKRNGCTITVAQAVQGDTVADSEGVARNLAITVRAHLAGSATTLLVSGGATAEALFREMGIDRFRLIGECLPGLCLMQCQGHSVITKSGGFGSPDTLVQVAKKAMGTRG